MATHQWSPAQLERIQAGFEKDDMGADAQRALLAERAGFGVHTIGAMIAGDPSVSMDDLTEGKVKFNIRQHLMPAGWLCFELVNYCRGMDSFMMPYDDWRAGRLDTKGFLDRLNRAEHQFDNESRIGTILHHRLFSRLLLPALGKVHYKSLLAQTCSIEAGTACALERYFLAKKAYPENLEVLVPAYLARVPLDMMTGKPMAYRRESTQSYTLYSVGRNLVDEGGRVALNKNGSVDADQGDWVWHIPAK